MTDAAGRAHRIAAAAGRDGCDWKAALASLDGRVGTDWKAVIASRAGCYPVDWKKGVRTLTGKDWRQGLPDILALLDD